MLQGQIVNSELYLLSNWFKLQSDSSSPEKSTFAFSLLFYLQVKPRTNAYMTKLVQILFSSRVPQDTFCSTALLV